MKSPGARLREAYSKRCIPVPGVFNALVARMAQGAGFEAMYLSGAALSAGLAAVPDVGLLSADEFVEQARYLTQASDLPLIVDIDTGFGAPLNVERTVRRMEEAGVAGVQVEDQQLPKRCGHLSGKKLVETEEMEQKIRAAVSARRDDSFVIIARTDARGVTGFDDAVERARRYVAAGADVIFPEAMETVAEFGRFASALDVPLIANMTEFGKSPLLSVQELHDLGYRMALFPVTTFRTAMRAAERTLEEIKSTGTQRGIVGDMLTRAQLYDLLGYDGYEARDRAYFGRSK
ncbi:MAG: methylisocitrate lyase [SAR202 cluster bacterium]|nr:methylisocitrate lyase [SAR202 cluster bacterium]